MSMDVKGSAGSGCAVDGGYKPSPGVSQLRPDARRNAVHDAEASSSGAVLVQQRTPASPRYEFADKEQDAIFRSVQKHLPPDLAAIVTGLLGPVELAGPEATYASEARRLEFPRCIQRWQELSADVQVVLAVARPKPPWLGLQVRSMEFDVHNSIAKVVVAAQAAIELGILSEEQACGQKTVTFLYDLSRHAPYLDCKADYATDFYIRTGEKLPSDDKGSKPATPGRRQPFREPAPAGLLQRIRGWFKKS